MNILRNDQSAPSTMSVDRLPGVPVKDLYALSLLERGRILPLFLYEKARKTLRCIRGRERWNT